MQSLTLSLDAYNAQLLRGIIAATAPACEDAADVQSRAATILAKFNGFGSQAAMESTVACHCVALQFALLALPRDAAGAQDPRTQTRMWTTGVSLSKALQA